MKALWLGRFARPDIIKPIGDLATVATQVQKWSRNNDKQLHRLVCYINSSKSHRLVGTFTTTQEVDPDFAGEGRRQVYLWSVPRAERTQVLFPPV